MTRTTLANNTTLSPVLYMAMELSQNKWCIAFGNGVKTRQVTLESGDKIGLIEEIKKAKLKLGLSEESEVLSCYEAGRDGFWIHRWLETEGIKNIVIDSSSIKVNRKSRHAKTDRLDASRLLKQFSGIRIPDMYLLIFLSNIYLLRTPSLVKRIISFNFIAFNRI